MPVARSFRNGASSCQRAARLPNPHFQLARAPTASTTCATARRVVNPRPRSITTSYHTATVRHQGRRRSPWVIAAATAMAIPRRGARGDIAIFSTRIARYQFAGFSTSASPDESEAARGGLHALPATRA
ncbi:hypothetical protein KCP69_03410 [Salmonella enterica subsp. enterica]|nr:hypothetical protein KCP69_03410 [Salmonella enterica subsp. enterica]